MHHDPSADEPLLTVVYTGEPEEIHEFAADGERRRFGRDDGCDIVVWSAINSTGLSAVAGEVWRMDGELWVRNLSTAHELWVDVPGLPRESPLPPRASERDRGAARSIRETLAYVRGPDGCELRVRQLWPEPITVLPPEAMSGGTTRVKPVPEGLWQVALALCEPLFAGKQLPASYQQICRRIANPSQKQVRNRVEQLTSVYLDAVPELRAWQEQRMEREVAQMGMTGVPVVRKGIRHFEPAEDVVDAQERERRSALSLPTYYEVAQLLVRRRVVTVEDFVAEFGPVDTWPVDGRP